MFDVGFWELLIIFGLGLIFLGPERLPKVAGQVGRWVGRARRTASQLRRQLEQEINAEERNNIYKRPPDPPPSPAPESMSDDSDQETPDRPKEEDQTTANEH